MQKRETLTLFGNNKKRKPTDYDIGQYAQRVQKRVNEDYKYHHGNDVKAPRIEISKGRSYAKLVACDKNGIDKAAFAFIDMQNGDIFKARSWTSPATNFARGNIFDKNDGLERVYYTGVQ